VDGHQAGPERAAAGSGSAARAPKSESEGAVERRLEGGDVGLVDRHLVGGGLLVVARGIAAGIGEIVGGPENPRRPEKRDLKMLE
jgi:hypothetical protein